MNNENSPPINDRTERQKLGIDKWIKAGCRATLEWATGTGKSRCGILAIEKFFNKNPEKQVVIIVPTENLKIQWIKLLAEYGLILNVEVKVINSAVMKRFTADLLIIDEIHSILAPTFFKLFEMCRPIMILGLTATFERLDGKHVLLDRLCPICDTITVKEATLKGWLSPYKEYKVMIDVDLTEYNRVNQQFMDHFAFFNFDFDLAMKCVTDNAVRMQYAMHVQPNPEFRKQIIGETAAHAFGWNRALKARKDFVKNHPRKLEIAELILEHRQNCKAITFNSTIAQCEKFKIGSVVHSGNTKKKNRLTMEEFNEMENGVIHSSKSLTEGVDIKGLNLAIILHNTSSPRERIQKIGRVIRKEEGKNAEVFSLILRGTMEQNWFKKSSVGLSHIELNEDELISILTGKEVVKQEVIQDKQQFLFTF